MLLDFLQNPSCFVLLLAPPSWGKTSLILDLYEKSSKNMVFLSPLKSINLEFYKRASHLQGAIYLGDQKKCRLFLKSPPQKYLCVISVENLNFDILSFWETCSHEDRPLFVLDEFHLFYYWGESFRPLMWEHCMGIASIGASILGLSATCSPEIIEKWKVDFSLGMNEGYLLDMGNQTFFNPPQKLDFYPPFKIFNRLFVRDFIKKLLGKKLYPGRFLYFCKTRDEVDRWLNFCHGRKISALGCVGGEVEKFQQELQEKKDVRCIFATHALGHGVNLPLIKYVFISFPLENYDFWLQMAARGGRKKDSKYYLFSRDSFEVSLKKRIYLFFKMLLLSFFEV